MLEGHNDSLPAKAKREVHVVWILSTDHIQYKNADRRQEFRKAMVKTVKMLEKHHAFELRHGWDKEDRSLYLYREDRITPNGVTSFWRAFDNVVQFSDQAVGKPIKMIPNTAQFNFANQNMSSMSQPPPQPGPSNDGRYSNKPFKKWSKFKNINKLQSNKTFWKYHNKGRKLPPPLGTSSESSD